MPDTRVFIVDGHESFRRAAAAVVDETAGFRLVGAAATGAAALEALDGDAEPIDLLVVDVYLPDGDGVDIVHELRRRRPGVAVVFTSALRHDDLPDDLVGTADHAQRVAVVTKATFDADSLSTVGGSADTVFYPEADGSTAGRRT